jgi:hypothetical protein
VDDHLVAFAGDDDDDFEKVCGAVGTDDQPSVGVLAQVVDSHRVFDGVEDVVVRYAVPMGRRVDLHNNTVLRKVVPPVRARHRQHDR